MKVVRFVSIALYQPFLWLGCYVRYGGHKRTRQEFGYEYRTAERDYCERCFVFLSE
jgi:hypothetical protein